MTRLLALGCMLVCVTGCSDSPTAPTSPTPTGSPVLLTITPATSLLKVGANETFSAFAVFPDGSGTTVAAQWLIDQAAVATVQASGFITAIGPGVATLTARADERTASRSLRVIPDYAATWEGDARIVECRDGDPGDCTSAPCPTRGVCPPVYPPGRILRIAAVLTHRDEHVAGFVSVTECCPVIPAKGTIDLSGALILDGVLERRDSIGSYEWRLLDWKTTIDSATGSMRGSFVQTKPAFGNNRTTPPTRIRCEIIDLRRTSQVLRTF